MSPAGLALDEKKSRLYVVTKENNSLYVCDTKTEEGPGASAIVRRSLQLYPQPRKKRAVYLCLGRKKLWIYDTKKGLLTDSVATEDHPNDLALSKDGKWLYVANANSNSVTVIGTGDRRQAETLNAALFPDAPTGSTTNSVALSGDDKTLYVANADNNCLAVFDVSTPGNSRSKGFIPTGWYPTSVKTLGQKILVANGKGLTSTSNRIPADPERTGYKKSDPEPRTKSYSNMFTGTLSLINEPDESLLNRYARQVYLNTPYSKEREAPAAAPVPIKYVFYVLKENKSYDYILGDMPQGNGDTSLCIFGKKITPNAHAISDQFVLFDNFYVDGEVSADGHNWSMAAYATDFTEKNWPYNYAGRGGNYDFDGSRPIANPTKGFLWDYCHRAGVSFRNYGEFMDNGFPTVPLLKDSGNFCHNYPGWNLAIQDIYREKIFEHDFDSLVAIDAVRQLSIIYLPNDHTSGRSRGAYTPTARWRTTISPSAGLSNISRTARSGRKAPSSSSRTTTGGCADHVDMHRSVAYIASPHIKMHSVNHTPYSTSSMLRTMELILGLPPMSQYDAAATPMWGCFQATPDLRPYSALTPETDLNARNSANNASARLSEKFNFSKPDAAPDLQLGDIVWKSVKGENSAMPAPKRGAFVKVTKIDEDD
ncbi:bifunctional YncE family protein/alkaline phosphatase family protein [Puia sp. P3]|uniref:bifunctional YncE family protein/alkaline phosphatase family protein n=1 Tax=Puia sp. P3 TaxID=3423952 RepID=UPI003D672AF3